jgi:nucleoside-diphosphate-sugar epimerase
VAFAEVLASSIKRQRVETVIGLGSQAEFVPVNGPWSDDSPVRGTDPYSQAKVHVRQALEDSGADTIWMRLFSVYGPGDESDWVLSRVVEGARSSKAVTLGLCENPWSFLHVDDVVSAISYGVDRKVSGSVVVTGTYSRPLRDWLTEAAFAVSGQAEGLIFSRDGESGRSIDAKPEKLLAAGWHPKVDFRTGIRGFADWMYGPLAKI